MRKSFTAVIEQGSTFTDNFATEPYETGWASEARWFLNVMELTGELRVNVQLSPDGLTWCDEGSEPLTMLQTGLYSFALRDFGHWLRLNATITGDEPRAKLLIHLALKE